MDMLKNHSKGVSPIGRGHSVRQQVIWLTLLVSSLIIHWLFYNFLSGWVSVLQCANSRAIDLQQFCWHTLALLAWVWAAVLFIRGKLNTDGN